MPPPRRGPSPTGRTESEHRCAQHEGAPASAATDACRRAALRRLGLLATCGVFARVDASPGWPEITQPGVPGPAAFAARAEALRQLAIARGDQPYGAVVVQGDRIVGQGVSAVVTDADPTAHAERRAIRDAQRRTGSLDLSGCVLYGTSRACPQCEAAAQAARIARMYYGSAATDAGVPGSP